MELNESNDIKGAVFHIFHSVNNMILLIEQRSLH